MPQASLDPPPTDSREEVRTKPGRESPKVAPLQRLLSRHAALAWTLLGSAWSVILAFGIYEFRVMLTRISDLESLTEDQTEYIHLLHGWIYEVSESGNDYSHTLGRALCKPVFLGEIDLGLGECGGVKVPNFREVQAGMFSAVTPPIPPPPPPPALKK